MIRRGSRRHHVPVSTDGSSVLPTVSITLLTQQDCSLCDQAKSLLAQLQGAHGLGVTVHIEELALDTDRGRQLAEQAGVLFAPGVLLDGQPFSHGRLSERKLHKALLALNRPPGD